MLLGGGITAGLLCCGCFGGLAFIGINVINKQTEAVAQHLNANPKAQEVLGTPIEVNFLNGNDGVFEDSDDVFSVKGPKASGHVNVSFTDEFNAVIRTVELDVNGQRHDLSP